MKNLELELYPVTPSALAKVEPKEVITRKGFSMDATEEHLLSHCNAEEETESWCSDSCLAQALWGQRTTSFRREAQGRISYIGTQLEQRHRCLVREYGRRGRVDAFKLYETDGGTRQKVAFDVMLQRMERTGEWTAEKVAAMRRLLDYPVTPESTA